LIILIVSATVVALSSRIAAKSDRDLIITRLTSDAGLTTHPVISRDGNMIAYASDRGGGDNLDIWVQQVAGGTAVRLTNHPSDDMQPDFSPDGSKIVFRSQRDGGGIYLVPALGGHEQRLVAAKGASFPRFSPDGNSIAYFIGSVVGTAKIYIVSSTGGEPRELQLQIPWAKSPIWSPDGMYLMFLGSTNPLGLSTYDWWVAPAAGGQAVKSGALERFEQHGLSLSDEIRGLDSIFSIAAIPRAWLNDDQIIFSARLGDSTNLWRVTVDRKSWKIKNQPERVTAGSSQEFSPSLAKDGRIVFATVDQRQNLWTLPLETNAGRATGKAEVLTQTGVSNTRPSLSRDGRRLVFLSDKAGNADVWMREMEKGTEIALTATPWSESHPYITADGSKVLYISLEKPKPVMYVLPIGGGVRQKLCDDCTGPMGWSPDGLRILFLLRGDPLAGSHFMDVSTGTRVEVIRHPKRTVNMPRLSFDGEWLAFHLPMTDQERSPIFIAPLRSTPVAESDWIRITDGAGIEATPWWSPDGGILYFLSRRDGFQCIWAQRLNKSKRPTGAPFDIAHFHAARHRVREVGFGPGVGADKVVLTMNETSGNLWMTNFEGQR
jgi:Tol biopolymer transport system component